MTLPASISTPRLTLKPFESQHCMALFNAARESHDALYQWYDSVLTEPDLTPDDVAKYIEDSAARYANRSFIQFGLFDSSQIVLGAISLHHFNWNVPQSHMGCWIRKNEESKGYASEAVTAFTQLAFEELKLKRLELRIAVGNESSKAVATKLGFKFGGILKNAGVANDGTPLDMQIFTKTPAPKAVCS